MAEDSLKKKTVSGLFWSFADNFVTQGTNFVVGIILARLLSPQEFGLIGMIMIFILISRVFIDSGFGQALIRKQDCTPKDYSTIFFFNMGVGATFYLAIFLSAGAIGRFYNEPLLADMIKLLGLVLFLNAGSLIQSTILIKNINFKLQTKISMISAVSSGALGIWLAYQGWGVWSLVWKTLSQEMLNTVLLWAWNAWRPILVFSVASFKEMFGFGSRLLVSALIDTVFRSVYYVVIGKFYSAAELGYYTRADQFQSFPSSNLTNIVQRVSYPVLSSIQNDGPRLKNAYKKLIKSTMFISFFVLLGMAAAADTMILALVGAKWLPAVPYLRLLCLAGMTYPLHALNLNMLNVRGRSDLFLKLEVIKKIMSVFNIVMGIFFGIMVMLYCILGSTVIAYFLNSWWSGKMIGYPVKEQLGDIAPSFYGAVLMGACVYLAGLGLPLSPAVTFMMQIALGAGLAFLIGRMIKIEIFFEIEKFWKDRFMPGPKVDLAL